MIAERVRNELANAKAKGLRIGRLKTRDSYLIRKLRATGMTYRSIAVIAKCSSGAVAAEIRALKAEEKAQALELESSGQPVPKQEQSTQLPQTGVIELPEIEETKIELDFAS